MIYDFDLNHSSRKDLYHSFFGNAVARYLNIIQFAFDLSFTQVLIKKVGFELRENMSRMASVDLEYQNNSIKVMR